VSHHAKRLIVQFMAACCGRSKGDLDASGEQDPQVEVLKEMPPNSLSLGRVHGILDRMSNSKDASKVGREVEEEEEEDVDERALRQSSQVRNSMQMAAKLWPRGGTAWPEEPVDARSTSLTNLPSSSAGPVQRRRKGVKGKAHPKAFLADMIRLSEYSRMSPYVIGYEDR
jgi:hypothetical protein